MPTTYAIPDGRTVMAATLYSGNNGTQSITNTVNGVSFQPDFVWGKSRNIAENHALFDIVRGVNKTLYANLTNAEATDPGVSAFNSNGFTLNGATINATGYTYVAWQWNAGGSTVTNTSGTISAQVRANPTAGFSVVTASASGTSPVTIGHGLGVAPKMIIGKVRDVSSTNWYVYNSNISSVEYLVLNSTAAKATSSNIWDTAPTSTVFTVGNPQNGWAGGNTGSKTYVFYCFAPVAGYSAFGSYTGNNLADGPFVYLGFRPRFIMIKSTSVGTEWVMIDTARSSYNLSETALYANRDYTESTIGTVNDVDILSNGFKLRNNTGFVNASQTYIYMAFAENPFKYANAR